MELKLVRIFFGKKYTIGKLYIDGVYFCDTLEDIPRKVKVMHETCIPSGLYKVIISPSGRFKRLMPYLLDVPGFTGILIHNGRDQNNTSGCILVGRNTIVGQLTDSKEVFENLFQILNTTKEKITINVC